MAETNPYFVVTPDSAAQTRVFGNMGVYGSRGYTPENKVNDAGGALEFLLVDARNKNSVKDGVASIKSENVGELTIDAEVLSTTGALNVSGYGKVASSLTVGSSELPAPTTLNGSVTMNGNVTMVGVEEISDDAGNTTVSISLGNPDGPNGPNGIKIYVSTIGNPNSALHSSLDAPVGSLFIDTPEQALFIKIPNTWQQFKV